MSDEHKMKTQKKSRRTFLQSAAAVTGTGALGFSPWPLRLLAQVQKDPQLASHVPWIGQGKCRLLVRVDPIDIAQRLQEETPAEIVLDFSQMHELGGADAANIGSIQVMKFDPSTGESERYDHYAYARSLYDRPFRWYDSSIPYDFPDFYDAANRTDGVIHYKNRLRAGYFYGALGDWRSGHLAWEHTQNRQEASYYAIYFDLLPVGKTPSENPPAGWLKDGMPRFDAVGEGSTGVTQVSIALDDWNDDGRIDIIFGEDYGHLFLLPNTGSKSKPAFTHYKMIFDAEGMPIDAGTTSAPVIVDWDGDGKKDLLIGTNWNRVLFFKNIGTNRERRYEYKGFLLADGKPLELPITPLVKGSESIFNEDYYPVLDAVDWNGDGNVDLLAGGYVTGRIYYYENVGRDADGMPILKFRGPLEADGKPINVGEWCASPCAADFDGDGDLDLITGRYAWGTPDPEHSLRYYENIGTRRNPILTERAFPKEGLLPSLNLSVPRAADLNGNGLLDLVVSCGPNIYIFENIGTKSDPRFRVTDQPLSSRWNRADLPGTGAYYGSQFMDWNHDGKQDVVTNFTVKLNSGKGNPGVYDRTVNVLPAGEMIAHPSGMGDDWFWARQYDLDDDGRLDVLFGDWGGHVWFHRNLSDGADIKFDLKGVMLKTVDGNPIKVGPIGLDPKKNFAALQGARTVFTAADFAGDGRLDLVVSDTFGVVRYYRNLGPKSDPIFDLPVVIAETKDRGMVDAIDWNGDGRMDVIVGTSDGRVMVFLNTGTRSAPKFSQPLILNLPPIIEPRVIIADIDGSGQQDLFIPGTQGSCLICRTFLEHGYANSQLLRVERKK